MSRQTANFGTACTTGTMVNHFIVNRLSKSCFGAPRPRMGRKRGTRWQPKTQMQNKSSASAGLSTADARHRDHRLRVAPEAVEPTGITNQLHLGFHVTSPEGELLEVGLFVTTIAERNAGEFRRQHVDALAQTSSSATEPEITEAPIPYSGGGAGGQIGYDIAIAIVGNTAFELLKAQVRQSLPARRSAGGSVDN